MVCKLADVKTFWLKLKTKWSKSYCASILVKKVYVELEMYIKCQSGYWVSTLGGQNKTENYILWIDLMPSRPKLDIILQNKMSEN